jgi:hypothetical protein
VLWSAERQKPQKLEAALTGVRWTKRRAKYYDDTTLKINIPTPEQYEFIHTDTFGVESVKTLQLLSACVSCDVPQG